MRSVRSLVLCSVGCIAICASAVVSFAQPRDEPPAPPASAPKDQPPGAPPRGGQPGGDGPRGGGRGAAASTQQGMSIMNRALRTLKSQVNDAAKKDENLKAINDLQRGCLAAKGANPDRALGRMDEAKRADAKIKYRRALIQIMEKALKAETALLDGKNADAAKIIDEIEKLRDDSHAAMGVGDDGGGDGFGGGGHDGGPAGPAGPGGR